MMFLLLLTSVALVTATVATHAVGTILWTRFLGRRYMGPDGAIKAHRTLPALIWTALVMLLLHLIEIVVWAAAYMLLLPASQVPTFETAVYFSVVTFTTVGYGDITLVDHEWRVLSGIEGLNGVVLVGWTTALLFAVFQRGWKGLTQAPRP